MTVIFRAVATNDNGAGGSSLTITKPTGVVAGDVMLAAISGEADLLAFVLNGWRELDISPVEVDATGGSGGTILLRLHVYIRVADGNEPASYVFDLKSGTDVLVGAIVAYSGVECSTPINTSAKAGSAGATTAVPSITTTVDGCMQVALYAHEGPKTYTPPSGMAERYDVQDGTNAFTISGADVLLGTAGVVPAKTATPSSNGAPSGAFSIALQPLVPAQLVIGGPSGLPEDIAGGFSLG